MRAGVPRFLALLLAGLLAGAGGGCASSSGAKTASLRHGKELLYGPPRPRALVSAGGMVVATSPQAARVGARVLEEGGTALDAAVATIFALMPTDPSSVSPGGELILVLHRATGEDVVLDAPSFVPMRVQPQELADMKREGRLWGPKVATVPTILAVLGTAQERYGTWSLQRLMAPAIEIAGRGFELGYYQRMAMREYRKILRANPDGASMLRFRPDGTLPAVGTRIVFPGLVTTLQRLAQAGWRDFYRGRLALAIESDMRQHGGWITRADLSRVPRRVRISEPLETPYRGHRILTPGQPWGGPALSEALEILRQFPAGLLKSDSTNHVHLMIEAVRLAQFDQIRKQRRNLFVGGALHDTSLPSGARALARAIDFSRKVPLEEQGPSDTPPMGDRNTIHVDVLDRHGNAVAATVTLGRFFGCHAGSPGLGFFYNSLMESFQYDSPRRPQYPQPLAPVFSYLTPTIALGGNGQILALGTGGSGRITSFVLEVLSNVLDRGMPLAEAVAHPRVAWTGPEEKTVELEAIPPLGPGIAAELRRRGFGNPMVITYPAIIDDRAHMGGVDCASFDPATGLYTGVGDPRREGFAAAPGGQPAGGAAP